MKYVNIFFIMALSLTAYAADNWRVEVLLEEGLDVMRVYQTPDGKTPLLTVRAEAGSQGFISAEEVYIRTVNRKYLLTRWILGATGSETLKIYDVASKSKREVFKLQSMPVSYVIKGNRIVFEIPNQLGEPITTEWVAK